MSGGNIERVKRELLRGAVAENVDTIRGLPPRSLRPVRRFGHAWLRRLPIILLLPLTLFGSTYLGDRRVTSSRNVSGSQPPRHIQRTEIALPQIPDVIEPLSAAAFPLSI